MPDRSASPEVRMVPAKRFCRSLNSVSWRSSAMPSTPFMGVRISWLMLARNWLLARLAASAASFARVSSAVRDSTSDSRWSRCPRNSSSRASMCASMVLNASASAPTSSLPPFSARRA